MKRVLFIGPFDTNGRFEGGISYFVNTIISNQTDFKKNGFYFVPQNNCFYKRGANSKGKLKFKNFLNYLKLRKAVKRAVRQNNIEAIYINSSIGLALLKDLLVVKGLKKKGIKVFIHIHFSDFDRIFGKSMLLKHIIKKKLKNDVSKIVLLSEELKNRFIKNGFDENGIFVIYNFVDPNLTTITKDFITQKYSTEKKGLKYLFVGSLDKRKGFYDLIDAFKKFGKSNDKLIICGSPNDNKSKQTLNEIAKNKKFTYKGYIRGNEKESVFKDCDVFILPSYAEGLPIVVLEALHFGLPIISTNVGAIPEILSERNGFLFKPGDKEALKNSLNLFHPFGDTEISIALNNLEESSKYNYKTFCGKIINILDQEL